MNTSHILESMNMTKGESLTLEKAKDRMEFEALPIINHANTDHCPTLTTCTCNAVNSNDCISNKR